MLEFGAIATLLLALVYTYDSLDEMVQCCPWEREAIAAIVYLVLFIGFYTAQVLVP